MEPWWRMSDVSCSLSVKRQMLSLRPGANCQKWSDSGSMDFQSVSATWMYARAVGEPLNSDDPDQGIPFHGPSYGTFDWEFDTAKGVENPNPFSSTGASLNTTAQIDSNGGGSKRSRIITTHGVLACMAFVIFFPSGAVSLRMLHFRNVVWLHAGMQGFAFLLYIIAFGMGIHLSKGNYVSSELLSLE